MGWFDGATEVFDGDAAGDYNLVAEWTPTVGFFTVSYDIDGGDSGAIGNQSYTIEEFITLPDEPTKAGYIFNSWSSGLLTYNGGEQAETVTLTAVWDIDPFWFTVSYNSAGGSPVVDQDYDINGEISLPAAPARYGFDFAGWYLSTIPTLRFIGGEAAGNITLVAHWTDWAENDPRWGP